MGWKAIVHSAKGTSHKKQGTLCQDYGEVLITGENNDIVIGAVADGAGSAKSSDIGAQHSVKTALSCLQKWLDDQQKNQLSLQNGEKEKNEKWAKSFFEYLLRAVYYDLQETGKTNKLPIKDLSCTLLVFIATPEWLAAMQIGDGFIVVSAETDNYQLLFKPSKGEYANVTTFVTSNNALSQMQVTFLAEHYNFICLSTDGLERLAIDMKTMIPSPDFFGPLQNGLKLREAAQEQEDLKNWLDQPKINEKTDDDKTLLICVYEQKVSPKQPDKPPESKSKNGYKLRNNLLLVQQFMFNALSGFVWNSNYHTKLERLWKIAGWIALGVVIFIFNLLSLGVLNLSNRREITDKYNKSQVVIISLIIALIGLLFGAWFYFVLFINKRI